MTKRLPGIGCLAACLCALAVNGQTAGFPQASSPAPMSTAVAPPRAILNQYCVGCHGQRAKAAGLEAARTQIKYQLVFSQVYDYLNGGVLMLRKRIAGMMPPAVSHTP